MDLKHPDYPKFKQKFWKWFDSLPPRKKRVFQRYKDDSAETHFYFTVWEKRHEKQNHTSSD